LGFVALVQLSKLLQVSKQQQLRSTKAALPSADEDSTKQEKPKKKDKHGKEEQNKKGLMIFEDEKTQEVESSGAEQDEFSGLEDGSESESDFASDSGSISSNSVLIVVKDEDERFGAAEVDKDTDKATRAQGFMYKLMQDPGMNLARCRKSFERVATRRSRDGNDGRWCNGNGRGVRAI
jgi:hypothetical protein